MWCQIWDLEEQDTIFLISYFTKKLILLYLKYTLWLKWLEQNKKVLNRIEAEVGKSNEIIALL